VTVSLKLKLRQKVGAFSAHLLPRLWVEERLSDTISGNATALPQFFRPGANSQEEDSCFVPLMFLAAMIL
jgi:hypothetical protein